MLTHESAFGCVEEQFATLKYALFQDIIFKLVISKGQKTQGEPLTFPQLSKSI